MSLKDELDQFHGLFKQHLNGTKQAALRWVTATEIDWNEKTMTAEDSDGLPYYDVLLGVSNVKVKPKPGTDCLIAILEGNEATAFLLYADEADLVEYNDGNNGGLANVPELKGQLEKMTTRIDGIIEALKNGVVVAGDGGSSYKITVVASLESITKKEDFSKIEDTKITH
jgi:hypothetical protein